MLHKLTAAATAGIEKTRIRSAELKLGMFVTQLDRPWVDSPFLIHGFTIRKQQELTQLQQLCGYVYVDISRGASSSDANRGSKPKSTVAYENSQSFSDNLDQALQIHSQAKSVVVGLFDAFRSGGMFDGDSVRTAVQDCVKNIIVNPDSMLWLSMIKNKDEYTVEHSLNVALLSIALGRAEGLNQDDLEVLGICAMLHDVGKVKIPDEILNKEGNLDQAEYEVMKMHTVHGKKMLMGTPNLPEAAVDVALYHHEKLDGTGYPRGLKKNEIPYLVKIVAIADAYDAMTSGRIYSDAKPAAEALKLLLETKDTHHDSELLNKFIDCIGVYPIGSIAELNTGEVGIVLPSDSGNKLQPRILVTLDGEKIICDERIIDLSKEKRPDNKRSYMIRALHPDGTFGIKLADFRTAAIEINPNVS